MPADLHVGVETLIILLLVICAVAIVVQWVRLPYPIALVLVGFLGVQPGFHQIYLTPDLILLIFLPILLFEGAYNVSARRLWSNILPIAVLAIPGVFLGTLVTAALVSLVIGLPWSLALLFGALISSTDPIAVISLFKSLGVPPRLALLVEGESLFNDGASITLFQVLLVIITTGQFHLGLSVLTFVLTVVGALVVGGVIGYGGSLLLRLVDNPQLQVTASLLAAYGSYLLAEHLTFSGAIAVVVTGLLFGNYGATRGVSPRAVFALSLTWEFLGFLANSLVFLLIGIELDPLIIARNWQVISLAFLATVVGRACVIFGLLPWLRGKWRIPWRFQPALVWGGLRGAVALALVLSIPFTLPGGAPFPQRPLLQVLAFGVVGASLLLQGLTMRPLIRALGVTRVKEPTDELADARARLVAIDGALLSLSGAHDRAEVSDLQYARLSGAYQLELAQRQQQIEELEQAQEQLDAQ